jgi:prevent-host-death family protein
MTTASISELKDRFSDFMRRVERGDEVVVTRHNVPIATITPLPKPSTNQTKLGCLAGSIAVKGDLTEPALPASDWEMLQG